MFLIIKTYEYELLPHIIIKFYYRLPELHIYYYISNILRYIDKEIYIFPYFYFLFFIIFKYKIFYIQK